MDGLDMEIVNGEPEKEDMLIISKGMLAHHASQGHPRNLQTISILLKDDKKNLFGSVIMGLHWNGMEVRTLWVSELMRGKDWGTKLMQAAEKEAVKRNCDFIYSNTFSWQAPGFYEKLGYKVYGKLEGFPGDSSLTYFVKKLG